MGPDTSAYYSCSATLNGELFVFGGEGSGQNKQVIFLYQKPIRSNSSIKISKIVDCTMKRIGELPQAFEKGACGTYSFDGAERVMFCFPLSDKNKCFRYSIIG